MKQTTKRKKTLEKNGYTCNRLFEIGTETLEKLFDLFSQFPQFDLDELVKGIENRELEMSVNRQEMDGFQQMTEEEIAEKIKEVERIGTSLGIMSEYEGYLLSIPDKRRDKEQEKHKQTKKILKQTLQRKKQQEE